jgi:hypothetical protein
MSDKKTISKKQVSKTSTMDGFIISNSIKKAWAIFKKEWLIVIVLLALPMVLSFGYLFIAGGGSFQQAEDPNIWLYLTYLIAQLIVGMGVIKGFLQVVRGKKVTIETFTDMAPNILNYLGSQILMILVVLGGFLLLIIPGFYFALKYMFASYLVIDKGLGPIDAMKASADLTKGVKWDIIGFMGASMILMYAGILALFVGLLISVPVATLAYAVFYDALLKRKK